MDRPERPPPSLGFACGMLLPSSPEVEIVAIEARSATVSWTYTQNVARKFHIDVLALSANGYARRDGNSSSAKELAFFEVASGVTEFVLPQDTLRRANGPYCVRVMAELGPAERPRLTPAGKSPVFRTPPEPPSQVLLLKAAPELEENSIRVDWTPPVDDGGCPVVGYEVTFQDRPPALDLDGPADDAGDVARDAQEAAPDRCPDEPPAVSKADSDGALEALLDEISVGSLGTVSDVSLPWSPRADENSSRPIKEISKPELPVVDADPDPTSREAPRSSFQNCQENSEPGPGGGHHIDPVTATKPSSHEDHTAGAVAKPCVRRVVETSECRFEIDGLRAGSGPYQIEIRAVNSAGLFSPAVELEVFTAVAAPALPTGLRARMLPGSWCAALKTSVEPGGEDAKAGLEDKQANDTFGKDLDIVRLDFITPVQDGGRPLQSYSVYAIIEKFEDGGTLSCAKPGQEATSSEPVLIGTTSAKSVLSNVGNDGKAGGACVWDVAVEPNQSYTFVLEANNGVLPSGLSEPSALVFIPARVPMPPREPPKAFCVQGGFAAELRWLSPVCGGGLPIQTFKVGILGQSSVGKTSADGWATEIEREITVGGAAANDAANDTSSAVSWKPVDPIRSGEAIYGTRIDGLKADAKYCFVLAASNAMGTGRWSEPSLLLTTPLAAPESPVKAVATIMIDDKSRVVATVSWESGRGRPATSGAVAAFNALLAPVSSMSSSSGASPRDSVMRERIPVGEHVQPWTRFTWTVPLPGPGSYSVEVCAESSTGQRSPPAALALDVRPELFPPPEDDANQTLHWAEEPLLCLGPAANAEDTRFGEFDESTTWLQALLLWHDRDPLGPLQEEKAPGVQRMSSGRHDSGVDVICSYRRPGSSFAHVAVLAAGVSASRLQAALPAGVPMSLRLVLRTEPVELVTVIKPSVRRKGKVQSVPMLIMLSDSSEYLRPTWEVWARQAVGGGPSRWTELPEDQNHLLETAWLEEGNLAKVQFELPGSGGSGCLLAPGHYEVTFGDERQIQHSVRRLGMAGGWTAKARRVVHDPISDDGPEAPAPTAVAEDQCIVCMEARRTHAFMHADTGDGHLAVCAPCADAFRSAAGPAQTCPVCRRGFSALQRIYH